MNKYTPGPWSVKEDSPRTVLMGAGCAIVARNTRRGSLEPTEAEANARLIAAAPEMLEALIDLVAEHDAEPWDHEGPWYGRNDTNGIALARDAIAKATK